jgi:hypothetical protein
LGQTQGPNTGTTTSTQGKSKTGVKSDERSNSLRQRRVPQNDNVESEKSVRQTHRAVSINMIHANSRRIEFRHIL